MRLRPMFIAVLMTAALVARAQIAPNSHNYTWPSVSSTGTTQYLNLRVADVFSNGTLVSSNQTVDVTLGAGANSACTWQLEGSNDLINWYSLTGSQGCTAPMMISVVQRPTLYIRINVLTYTGTAALTFNWVGL